MSWHVVLAALVVAGVCEGAIWGPGRDEDRCEAAIKETIREDRATIVDETPNRLHSTWLSQECEVRAGPEYVIRKYTFFENGTFLLLRHYYAEESCSVAMYTVAARGVIRVLSNSNVAPGASDARFQLDRVHIVPLTRQVAQKYSHRVNFSCTPQPRWRPYVPQLIYEQPSRRFSNFLWQGPKYNTLQPRHYQASKKHRGIDCLEALGIEFGELRLVRVQKRTSIINAFDLGSSDIPRIELYLGSLPPNVYSRKTHKSTSLQPTALLRADTVKGCLVCGAISRGTESSPPLLHEVAALPALLGGSWLSSSCESCEGGLWIKRQLEVYAGDSLWTGRWDYYSDPRCAVFLYAVTAAGSYIQRPGRQRRHGEESPGPETFEHFIGDDDARGASSVRAGQSTASFVERPRRFADDKTPVEASQRRDETEKRSSDDDYRSKKTLAEWMTPELARNLFEIYGSKKEMSGAMLPSAEELDEAIGTLAADGPVDNSEKVGSSDRPNKTTSESHFASSNNEESSENSRNAQDPSATSPTPPSSTGERKSRRSLESEDSYRHLLQNAKPSMADAFAAMLRGNQRREETTRKPMTSSIPAGTTELDLHVAESLLVAGDLAIAARCGAQIYGDDRELGNRGLRVRPLVNWPRSCVKHALEAPSTLGLRARVGVNWSGQYTLLLGPRDDHLWEAPLHQCGPTPSHNPALRAHLRRSVGIRYGLYTSAAARFSDYYGKSFIVQQSVMLLCYLLYR
ncbi:uncharacterized protein [Venturia canescens]|uniref:uncharacterized protein n=1 Tax=Venturia canescens TaxID=32260 RepID=UPI001C9CB81C|nr:uncharacterized protein LOC122413029 [Venturia canescens]